MPELSLYCPSLDDLPKVSEKILAACNPARIFAFFGKLGAGKTTLIQHLCASLGVIETVTSPTYNLVNEYSAVNTQIYHFDFYRIKSETEAYDIGTEEYLDSTHYVFIEWPERIPTLLPTDAVQIQIEVRSDQERHITVSY